jgi:hypothetical protein
MRIWELRSGRRRIGWKFLCQQGLSTPYENLYIVNSSLICGDAETSE